MVCPTCPRPTLLPEAQPDVAAYMQCDTQWRTSFGGRVGLDYPACLAILKLHRAHWRREHPDDPLMTTPLSELMQGIQIIEAAMLQADHERHEEEQQRREAERAIGKQ